MAVSAGVALISTGVSAGVAVAAGTTFAFAGLTGMAAFGAAFATSFVLGAAMKALAPKPSINGLNGANRGYQVNSRGSALDHQIIYGKMRVGGAIVYDEATGTDNKYLHRVIAVAGHEVQSFDEIYIDDEVVTLDGSGNVTSPSRFSGKVRIRTHLGSPDQSADSALVSESSKWTNAHRLRGIAYMYVRLRFDPDVFPNGTPTFTATIKGKKVYNPDTDTTAWSDNPALCLRDYLISSYGLAEDTDNIDDTLVNSAVTVCNQTNTDAGTTRYTCNGAFTTDLAPYDIINNLLTSMGGTLWYAQGKWRMKPAYWTTPVLDLDEDHLRSSISVGTRHSRRDNFNVVKGTFRGEESNWQTTDYPQVENSTFLTADNGQESVADVDLPFTDNSIEARRLARIALEANRQQLTVNASFGLEAMKVQVGDNIRLTNSRFGWTNKEFEVISWNFGLADGLDLQVQMVLRETAESVFDEVDDGVVYERDNTTLVSAFDVPSVGLALEADLKIVNQEVFGVINVEVQGSSDLTEYYEVQYKLSSQADFRVLGSGTSQKFEILIPEDGQYDVRARAVNTFGVKGDWTTFTNFTSTAFSEPPEDVVNFSANVSGETAQLSWTPVGDLDLSHYEIRYSPLTTGAIWSRSVILIPKVGRPATTASVPAREGSYLIKAVDKLGGKSPNATTTVVLTSLREILALNVVQNTEESPDFNGVKDDTVKVTHEGSPALVLDSSNSFEDVAGNFDDVLGLFDGGNETVLPEGIYNFEDILDLGSKYGVTIFSSLTFQHLNYVDTFDSATGLFDDKSGNFDGDPDVLDSATAKVQVSSTNDDPSGSPTWSDWQDFVVTTLTARAFRFRAVLLSTDPAVSPLVSQLSVTVDMPDRVEAQNDISFTGTTNVTFPTGFYTTSNPSIGLALTGLGSGDYYAITSKSNTGFTVTAYDSTDTQLTTSTQLDYVAKGFGREITA